MLTIPRPRRGAPAAIITGGLCESQFLQTIDTASKSPGGYDVHGRPFWFGLDLIEPPLFVEIGAVCSVQGSGGFAVRAADGRVIDAFAPATAEAGIQCVYAPREWCSRGVVDGQPLVYGAIITRTQARAAFMTAVGCVPPAPFAPVAGDAGRTHAGRLFQGGVFYGGQPHYMPACRAGRYPAHSEAVSTRVTCLDCQRLVPALVDQVNAALAG